MKFIFPEKAVNKNLFVLFLSIISFTSFSQDLSDSLYLYKTSESVLEKTITFTWKGGSLSDALDMIALDNKVKFSFSNSWIQHIPVAPQEQNFIALSNLLDIIFKDSGFNYLLVGRIIAVVKDDTNLPSQTSTPTDSSSTNAATQKQEINHIYTPDAPREITPYERKLLYEIYKKELKWTKQQRKLENKKGADTLTNKEKVDKALQSINRQHYFIMAGLGLQNNLLGVRNNSPYNWRDELQWKTSVQLSLYPEIVAGIRVHRFLLGTGMGVHKLQFNNSFTETKKSPPAPAPVPATETKSFSEKYTFVSIPLSILYTKQWNKVWAGAGGGARFNFIKGNEVKKPPLKKYHDECSKTKTYSESYKSFVPSIYIEGNVGYTFAKNCTITAGFIYNYSLRPVYENSLYSLKENSLAVRFRLFYEFGGGYKRSGL